MHPRNPYRNPLNFTHLAEKYTPLSPYVSSGTMDFRDPEAQRQLTKAILHVDFDLDLELPEDRLCPPIPNRLNYVLWIEDLVEATRKVEAYVSPQEGQKPKDGPVRGLDVGTGSSAIYPLLICRHKESWSMVATEIDTVSLGYAEGNVKTNNLQDRIRITQASPDFLFGPLFDDPHLNVAFTMCNPPFYSSPADIRASKEAKDEDALSICTGSSNEMVYPPSERSPRFGKSNAEFAASYIDAFREGGEVAFVAQMIDESLELRDRGGWYTSMLGKMSSVPKVVLLLKSAGIGGNWAVTQFVQGQTRRWAVGWRAGDKSVFRLPDDLVKMAHLPSGHALSQCQPARTTSERQFDEPILDSLRSVVEAIQAEGDGAISISTAEGVVLVRAKENTWSRAARRKRGKRKREVEQTFAERKRPRLEVEGPHRSSEPDDSDAPWTMICTLEAVGDGRRLRSQWCYGSDSNREMWEGFIRHVERRILDSAS